MRILIVDHYYPAFVASIYGTDGRLAQRSYAEQRATLDAALFGETVYEVAALRALGHEAWDSLVNVYPLQVAWIREHGGQPPRSGAWGWRLRRGIIPWPRHYTDRWMGEILLAQVKALQPDVLHVQCVDLLGADLIQVLRGLVRVITGQIAAPLNDDRILGNYHLAISSLPNFVERFRALGYEAEWLPLAFEPTLVEEVGRRDRDIPVSFVGSLSSHHRARIHLLEAVADAVDLQIWSGDTGAAVGPSLRRRIQGPAWGRGMYEVLARSRVTLNNHIDVAEGFANNLRLYEATGMGALLLTDHGTNLGDLFEVGREVATYNSPADCAEKAAGYAARPAEATRMGKLGQARTLRDHTWLDRMARLISLVEARM